MALSVTFRDPVDLARVMAALHRAADAEEHDRTYLATRWRAIADQLEDAVGSGSGAIAVHPLDPETGCCPHSVDAARFARMVEEARRGHDAVEAARQAALLRLTELARTPA